MKAGEWRPSDWTVAADRWRAISTSARARADRISASLMDEARATAEAAGVGREGLGTTLHNAWLSGQDGRPWAGVDYALVRRARWLIERSFLPGRLAERISARAWNRLMVPVGACGVNEPEVRADAA